MNLRTMTLLWPLLGVGLTGGCMSESRSTSTSSLASERGNGAEDATLGSAGFPEPGTGSFAEDTVAADIAVETRSALTLDQALTLAMDRDARLDEARARVRAARARQDQASQFPNPQLILRTENATFEGSTFDAADYLVGLSQPLPLGDRRERASEVARLESDQLAAALRVDVLVVRREVQGAFAVALYAQEAATRRDALLELTGEELAIAQARVRSGDAVPADLLPLELEQVEAQKEQKRAHAYLDQALLELAAALSSPDLVITSVEGDLTSSLELPSLRALVDDLSDHPVLKAATLRSDVARAQVELREAERIPDVTLELLYRRIESDDLNAFDIGASIPIRLFNDGRAAVELARSELDVATASQRRARQETELTLRSAHQHVEQALEMQRLMQEEVLPRLLARRDQAEARYRLGDIALEELLPVRRAALLQELGELESRREVMVAWAGLSPFLSRD